MQAQDGPLNNHWLNRRSLHHRLPSATAVEGYRTKSTGDISIAMFGLYCGGGFLWLIHGLYRQDIAIIANFLALTDSAL